MNPNLATFAQAAQGGQGGPPPGMPPMGGMPPQMGGTPQMGAPPMPPGVQQGPPQQRGQPQIPPQILAMLMQRAQQQQGGQQGPPRMSHPEMASQGRFGDTIMAHLTPGEIEVPPQVQSPKLLSELENAFHKKHVSMNQFMAGSPQSSINPKTGAPEYNFLSALLPTLLGIGGSLLAPELAPLLGVSGNLAGAVGGGLGNFLGGKLSGQNTQDALLSGALSGVGGYLGGKLFPNSTIGSMVGGNTPDPGPGLMNLGSPAAGGPGGGMSAPNTSGLPSFLAGMNPGALLGTALGGALAGGPQRQPLPIQQPGFNKGLTPMAQLSSPQTMLGQPNYRGPLPVAPQGNLNQYGYGPEQNFFPIQAQ